MLADWRNELLEIVIEQGDDEELVELDQAFRKFDVVDMQELAQADYIAIDIKENELTIAEDDQAFHKFDVVDMQELAQADYIAIDINENELTIAEDDQAEFERMIARYEIDEFEHLFALEGINAW